MNTFKFKDRWVGAKQYRKLRGLDGKRKIEIKPEDIKFPGLWCEVCGSKGTLHKKGCKLKQ